MRDRGSVRGMIEAEKNNEAVLFSETYRNPHPTKCRNILIGAYKWDAGRGFYAFLIGLF